VHGCAEYTIGSEIILDAPNGTHRVQDRCTVSPNVPLAHKSFWTHPIVLLGDEAQVEARFGPFGDSANPDVR
jgi:hypothetical protein